MAQLPEPTPIPPIAYRASTPKLPEEGENASRDDFSLPAFHLQIRDLKHPGVQRFLSAVNPTNSLTTGTLNVLKLLYRTPSDPDTTVPPTSSVTLVLQDMPGVAYTVGSDADNNVKEIHFSLSYIAQIDASRIAHEINGVITHELVHCFQYNGHGAAPSGLIEGVADWVRLHCNLSPPHWKQEIKDNWDAGYQHTAFFLEYLEQRFGHGTVRRVNEKLRVHKYVEEIFWIDLFGQKVKDLFAEYTKSLRDEL
ncbi:plant basic secretory [Trichoderma arundinaceum]|uniref:Plant basic secretory n=1 Tax=Trichoderma arundinaceum TaxID=490622 RepID=A0A395NV27_TRIAR|nr:plant basic secretory [Trichoderma arundinaceum]